MPQPNTRKAGRNVLPASGLYGVFRSCGVSGVGLLAAGLLSTGAPTFRATTFRATTFRATTAATTLHGFLAFFFAQFAVAVLVIFLKELGPAGSLGFLALVFVELAIAILIEFLEDFLRDLAGAASGRSPAFAFGTLTTLGAGLLLALVFFSKGGD